MSTEVSVTQNESPVDLVPGSAASLLASAKEALWNPRGPLTLVEMGGAAVLALVVAGSIEIGHAAVNLLHQGEQNVGQ